MFHLSTLELLIVLAIVVLIFGVGRIRKIAKDLGAGIKSFSEGLTSEDGSKVEEKADGPAKR